MKSNINAKPAQKWATMTGASKATFVAKVCIMVCTAGFVYGGVLVEGMVYPELPDHSKTPE